MYKRYYDGYPRVYQKSDNGEIVVPKEVPPADSVTVVSNEDGNEGDIALTSCSSKGFPFSFADNLDDIILIGILLFLLLDKDKGKNDDDNDIFMLLLIGFILFSDIL